jgi:serine phosphatase RsbU (regulator of sigma subunit)
VLAGGTVSMPDVSPSPPLGSGMQVEHDLSAIDLPDGWALLLFTDGLIEGRAAPEAVERYGLDRLLAGLATIPPGALLEYGTLDRLLDEVTRANGGELADDMAVLAVTTAAPR